MECSFCTAEQHTLRQMPANRLVICSCCILLLYSCQGGQGTESDIMLYSCQGGQGTESDIMPWGVCFIEAADNDRLASAERTTIHAQQHPLYLLLDHTVVCSK